MIYDLRSPLDQERFRTKALALLNKGVTVEEMRVAIDRFQRWAAENGIYIPEPGDEERLRDIEIEMGRLRQWL